MKERPIPFSGPMVLAIRDDRKTQTRRIMKEQPIPIPIGPPTPGVVYTSGYFEGESAPQYILDMCPYGRPGDRLIVKEDAWMWCAKVISSTQKTKSGKPKVSWCEVRSVNPIYCADHPDKPTHVPEGKRRREGSLDYCWHKKIGRFLPRWASRITLELTGVRIERLQDISAADAIAEGIERDAAEFKNYDHSCDEFPWLGGVGAAKLSYKTLWESIHGPGSWDANPFVWVLEFKEVKQ